MIDSRPKQRPTLRLQHERAVRNLSRAEVAVLAACSESAVSKLENGSRRGSWSLRRRLSTALDVPMDDLLREVIEDAEVAV
jgi:transcriptional regulator with XRE-family HTH domain